MATALISLGSNLGDRRAALDAAIGKLNETLGIQEVLRSSYHATKPVGGSSGQSDFLNAAARLDTSLLPHELLSQLQRIELELGRQRQEHWGPRTLDLDLLLYGDLVTYEPQLIVPHRFLPFRRFVLEPASEVASDMRHPVLDWTIAHLLMHARSAANIFKVVSRSEPITTAFSQQLTQGYPLLTTSSEISEDGQWVCYLSAGAIAAQANPKALLCLVDDDKKQLRQKIEVPTLSLPARNLDLAVREAVAAIQAMQ